MTDIHIGRRTFIKKTAAAAAAVTVPGTAGTPPEPLHPQVILLYLKQKV